MTLTNDINTTSTALKNIKDAINNKGGTVSGSITNYPNAINNLIKPVVNREVVNGKYVTPTTSFSFILPNNVIDLDDYVLHYAFYESSGLTSINMHSLTNISGKYSLSYAFSYCTALTNMDFYNLKTITGEACMQYAFQGCTSLISANFPSLTTISSNSYGLFKGSTSLSNVDFSNLKILNGYYALNSAFQNCTSLQTLNFPALTSTSFGSYTNQFNSMLSGVTGCTVHFPSNLQSVIGSWSSVTAGFGGTNTTVLFDLTATT